MTRMFKMLTGVMLALVLAVSLCSCDRDGVEPDTDAADLSAPHVVVSFDYERQSGSASNQFAVWIEDLDGSLVKTLYATRYTANGGYKNRPDSIPVWVEKSGLADMSKEAVDAVTGATPRAGGLEYVWDLTDDEGQTVPEGEYRYVVEGTLRWKNQVVFTGAITVGVEANLSEAEAKYTFEDGGSQQALTEASEELNMISAVKAEYRLGS